MPSLNLWKIVTCEKFSADYGDKNMKTLFMFYQKLSMETFFS